jgi:uncharacterized DUF497 family protein
MCPNYWVHHTLTLFIFNSTGFLGMAIVTICHTETEDEIHIISMRKAEFHEIEILSRYL